MSMAERVVMMLSREEVEGIAGIQEPDACATVVLCELM